MSAIRLIKNPPNPEPVTVSDSAIFFSRERAEFRSHMIMIQYWAENANLEESKYIVRNLHRVIALLEQKYEWMEKEGSCPENGENNET